MNKVKEVEKAYRKYITLCSELTNQISHFFLKREHGVTVSLINNYQIELLKKVHFDDELAMEEDCSDFNLLIPKLCEEFGLEIVRTESCSYKKMELDPKINTFRYERIILRGVKNE